MNGHYNNNNRTNPVTAGTTAIQDYGYKSNQTWLVTGEYTGSIEIDLQESSDTILTGTAAGENFTAFLDNNGTVWVWGDNQYGVLGQGNTSGSNGISNPNYNDHAASGSAVINPQKVQVAALRQTLTYIESAPGAGDMGTLKKDGDVTDTVYVDLGTLLKGSSYVEQVIIIQDAAGKEVSRTVNDLLAANTDPDKVDKVRVISAGQDHMVALTQSGKVYTWGRNQEGQLGYGSYNSDGSWENYSAYAHQVIIREDVVDAAGNPVLGLSLIHI